MSDQMTISLEAGKRITAADECALVATAYRRNPDSTLLRRRLAALLNINDRFADTVALYAQADPARLDFSEAMVLANAHLALGRDADTRAATALTLVALDRAETDAERATALADQGRALRRSGENSAAERVLRKALQLDPHHRDACKRLTALLLGQEDFARVIALTDRLMASGVGHAPLFAARVLAYIRLGEIDAAMAADGRSRLLRRSTLAPPPGWSDIAAFNAALAEELLRHPGLQFDRYGTASEQSWRIDEPVTGAAPMIRLLVEQLSLEIGRYVATLGDVDHPWARARPARGTLHCGCVMTDGAGFERWHLHQSGWLSGVYYVQIPDAIAFGEDRRGCIAFGVPEDLVGDAASAAFGMELVRPSAGMMMLFPSHNYHRTYAHGAGERRICVAFDLWPG